MVRRNRFSLLLYAVLAFGVAFLPDAVRPKSAHSAERIHFTVGPIDLTISVDSLETFVETGEITPEFRRYARYLDDETLEEIRPLLQQSFEANHVAVSQLAYSPIGETFLQQLGEVIQTQSRQNGFYAIRAAMIQAAEKPEGITLLNVIRAFPTEGIRINTRQVRELVQEFSILLEYQDATLQAIAEQAALEASTSTADFTQLPDLNQPGQFAVVKETVTITDPNRVSLLNGAPGRMYDADFYFPQNVPYSAPVIAISHGLGSNREEFSELASHLASYGFAVVVPEHIGSNTQFREDALSGLFYQLVRPEEFVDRPLDITVALNQLERFAQQNPTIAGQIDINTVGVIGHSFGGYTALALAGARLNNTRLMLECRGNQINLNISLLLQCLAGEIAANTEDLRDPRVQAVMALSPIPSTILGPEGMQAIDRPTFILAADNDFVAPAIAEQIYPFIWLRTPDKYLAVLSPASHLTVIDSILLGTASPLNELLIGSSEGLGSQYTQALSVAFMQVYVKQQPGYQPYLNAAYADYLSQDSLQLSLIRSLTIEQLEEAYGDTPPLPIDTLSE
jgi:predicted dienelactone hydrolase